MTDKKFKSKRFMIDDCGTLIDMDTRNTYDYTSDVVTLLNELHEENMKLRAEHTKSVIIMRDVVNDLKRMDTYRYAEHLEKITNLHFLSEEELEE